MVPVVRLWILLSTLLVAAGWMLSALSELNGLGYGIVFVLAAAAWPCWRPWVTGSNGGFTRAAGKIWRRLRRSLPRLFLILALFSLLSGSLYLPLDGDSNSYRIPRIFHWLTAGRWHWIHTLDSRMNIAGTGFEWLGSPLILLTRSNQWLFLINWFSFLLLPGLVYSMFTRLGVRPRAAWWWMWLVPSGWCYFFQAQTDVNDSFAAVYGLAAVDLALRSRNGGRSSDWWLAVLAAALLTGAKQTCIPLALVCAVAIFPGWRELGRRPVRVLLVVAAGLMVSVLPITVLNLLHTGNWMGLNPSRFGWANTTLNSPFWGFVGNIFCLSVQNLAPPVFPMAAEWNAAMARFVQTPFGSHFQSFETFGFLHRTTGEGSAGLGPVFCALLLVSIWGARRMVPASGPGPFSKPVAVNIRLIWLAPWVALAVFMMKIGSFENARQLAPYYVFLIPVLLAGNGQARLVRERWWRRLAGLVMLISILLVAGSRDRPLFPARTLFGWLHDKHPHSEPIERMLAAFSSQSAGQIQRHCFQSDLPPSEKIVGYYAVIWGSAEPGLWLPFGTRRVERILPDDSRAYLRSLHIHYVVIDGQTLLLTGESLDGWLRKYDADLVRDLAISFRWNSSPAHLYLARVRDRPGN